MPLQTLSLLLLLALFGAGCSLLPERIDATKDWSANRLYTEAKDALNSGDNATAIKYFEAIQARYPFGPYAQQAELEIIYAHYRDEEPAQAIAAADRFIKLHPKHPNVDYAYYMKGLANFNEGRGLVERYLPRDESERDPGAARQSFFDFQELVKRYPNSKYAKDARQRMLFLRNNLAEHEVRVAQYYLRRGAHVAAAQRAAYVVENYQRTPAVPDALAVMAKAYREMGLDDLSVDAIRVLKLNYPRHPALRGLSKRGA